MPMMMARRNNIIPLKGLICLSLVIVLSKGDVKWPDGEFAVPMSTLGCPDPTVNTWHYGYVNISFRDETDLIESSVGRAGWNGTRMNLIELVGPYGSHSIQLNFCYKFGERNENTQEWPPGGYSLYGSGNGCPPGLSETRVNRTLPEVLHVNKDGYVPDIDVHNYGNISIISYSVCQKLPEEEVDISQIYDGVSFPFSLISMEQSLYHIRNYSAIILRQLYLVSTDSKGETTTYDWLHYYTMTNIEPDISLKDPYFIEFYMNNSTIRYPSEEIITRGYIDMYYAYEEDQWILCDMGISSVISSVLLWGDRDAEFLPFIMVTPEVYTSEQKWSFLQNWALRCDRNIIMSSDYNLEYYMHWALIQCLNNPAGRYVSIVIPKVVVDMRPLMTSIWLAQFLSQKDSESPRCNIPMGMRERRIQDLQLTASSSIIGNQPHNARPHGVGWCAQLQDSIPYLQIDFLTSVQVEGIQIFNWPAYESVSLLQQRRGVSSLSVYYGLNASLLLILNQQFYLDPFLPPEDVQVLKLASPVMTRFLRIYTIREVDVGAVGVPVCLRLEIIGCPVFEDYLGIHTRPKLNTFIELDWDDKTIANPGILVSYGYPIYYPTGAATVWTYSVPEGQYITLLLQSFSLNKYKASLDSTSRTECTDILYLWTELSTFYHMYKFLKFIKTGKLDHDIQMEIILTSAQNNQQISLKTRSNLINIVFRTCDVTHEIAVHGTGFRLLAYATDIPSCVQFGYYPEIDYSLCNLYPANIISTTFLGIFSTLTEEDTTYNFWTLEKSYHEYITLQITDFDIGCDTGAIFEIVNGDMVTSYCNKNKPVYGIVSTNHIMTVRFQSKSCETHIFVEGFKGIFRAEVKNADIARFVSSNETDTNLFNHSSLKVCSETFNKCYVMLDLEAVNNSSDVEPDISWNIFNTYFCGKHGFSMVNIHSRLEQDFVGYNLQHGLQYLTRRHLSTSNGYYGYAYLGLRRGQTHHLWSDGSPVTYTSWALGHPLKSLLASCTRFNIRSLSANITWESVSCDHMEAEYGVCEYPLTAAITTSTSTLKTGTVRTPLSNNTAYMTGVEISLYFPCGDGEMISILGKCDGERDCISGRDEENCDYSDSCSVDQYRCNDGHCASVSVLCDHHADCKEGEDENCEFTECNEQEFKCNSMACIDSSLRCDGKSDCLTGEDELGCSSCNPLTSYNCDDNTCIPLAYRCDGVPDCLSQNDEKDCVLPDTCQEWWNAGYRENGMFTIHGEEMECDFDEINTTGRIVTKYHNIDFLDYGGKRGYQTRIEQIPGSESVLPVLLAKYDCYQTIDQLCQPWLQEMYDVDSNGPSKQVKRCQCLRWKQTFGDRPGEFEDCEDGALVPNPYSSLNFDIYWLNRFVKMFVNPPYFGLYGLEAPEDFRLRINPVVCFKDFIPKQHDIVCGNGITVPKEVECLYDMTEFGTVVGCRNLAHLQNCESVVCPDGFYKCPESFCLRKRFVCDGAKHCEHGEDEQECGTLDQLCVSEYRCLQSNICLVTEYLCDGFRQCPLGDDERLCSFSCPLGCDCTGMSADCRKADVYNSSVISISAKTKYLDISTNFNFFSFMTERPTKLSYLAFLNMSSCGVSEIPIDFFFTMKNLLILDLTNNILESLRSEMFVNQHKLTELLLTGNQDIHVIESSAFKGLESMKILVIRYAHIGRISEDAFDYLVLETLDLSSNIIDNFDDNAFNGLSVESLVMADTDIKLFQQDMFTGVAIANTLITDAYEFCCIRPVALPEENCYPHKDEFSSCADLMRNDVLGVLLWLIGIFSLLGNAASLIYRFIFDRERLKLGYGVFVTNLAVADFIMGIYLITIASADVAYRGIYIYNDRAWRNSGWCKMAGMLSTMSSEASVLFICLITIDRILVIKFPFGQVRFTTKLSKLASGMAWAIATFIAVLPFAVKSYFNDSFYSKSGVCLALPLTRDRPPGWAYAICIFIGFNFVTFLAIAFGQWIIYRTISKATAKMRSFSTGRAHDLHVSRNLLLVASTNFMCWFPIGILGILALNNHVIPGEVYAWTAVLVLPINSALNPFLYTLSAILGRGKFTPDADEQERTQVIPADHLEKHLNMWNNKMFVQPLYAKSLYPMTDYFENKCFNPQTCLGISVAIAKCVAFLHERNLSQSNLKLESIYIKKILKGSFSVVLSLQPKLIKNKEETQEEIKQLGRVIASLVKQCGIRYDS